MAPTSCTAAAWRLCARLYYEVDLPRLRGHPEKHESAVGVDDGETRQGQAAEVFG